MNEGMPITEALGIALQELRLAGNFTVKDIAQGIPCHPSTVAKMERGERLTHTRTRAYAVCLGLPYCKVVERAEAIMRQ